MDKKMSRRKERKIIEQGYVFTVLNSGLKKVHIGNDEWLIGKASVVGGHMHQVIYGPGNKEYHVWDKDVEFINEPKPSVSFFRQGNGADQARVKIYILTSILDKKENWCFDLNNTPPSGKLKIIYANGTVKNIDFTGTFNKEEISKNLWWYKKVFGDDKKVKKELVPPMAYRLS